MQRMDKDALPILTAFAEQFLSGSYNLLMSGLRRDLEPGLNISRLSEDDFLHFFKLAGFFTRFVRQQQVCVRLPMSFQQSLRNHKGHQATMEDALIPSPLLFSGRGSEGGTEEQRQCTGQCDRNLAICINICHDGLGDVLSGAVCVARHHRPSCCSTSVQVGAAGVMPPSTLEACSSASTSVLRDTLVLMPGCLMCSMPAWLC